MIRRNEPRYIDLLRFKVCCCPRRRLWRLGGFYGFLRESGLRYYAARDTVRHQNKLREAGARKTDNFVTFEISLELRCRSKGR